MVAIVTGAGSGIGDAVARRLPLAGGAVSASYLAYEGDAKGPGARPPKSIRVKADAVKADVSKQAEVQAMVDATVSGLGSVDVLVNNAGLERSMPFLEIDEATWDLMIDVDLKGAFLCAQACGRVMRDSGKGGTIVNISSIHEDVPFPGFTPYCAAKGGLRMMMRNAAIELAQYNIRINNVAPGAIATPINSETLTHPERVAMLKMIVPLMRMGRPEEVAEVALFLASDASSYVTGSTYYVDGGMVRYQQPL